jgi:hypothetical protein
MHQTAEDAAKQKVEAFFLILKQLQQERIQHETEKAREMLERSFFFKLSKFSKLFFKTTRHCFLFA